MLALGLVLNTLGIGLFCWLIFVLAVYALPFFVAVTVGMLAFRDGAGVFGALLIGIVSGALTLAAGQLTLTVSRSSTLRVAIATVFAVPAAIAGYQVVFALSQRGAFAGLARGLRLRRCALHRRHGMGAFDRFREDPPVGLGRSGGEYTSTSSYRRHARAMRLRRHQVQQARTETRLNERGARLSER